MAEELQPKWRARWPSDEAVLARLRAAVDRAGRGPRIGILGAGAGGMAFAMRAHQAGLRDVTILEKSDGFGGTWRDNTYPGCACDAPSHLYSFSFAPNPDWSRRYATQPEILAYLEAVAAEHDLGSIARFGCEVTAMAWSESTDEWVITTGTGEVVRFDVVVTALGQLSRPSVPELPGLPSFEGTVFHSARWDHDHDLAGERVAVVGTGASAIQFVPEVAKVAGHLSIFQRSPNWIAPKHDPAYSEHDRRRFRRSPRRRKLHRLGIFLRLESSWLLFRRNSRAGRWFARLGGDRLRDEVVSADLGVDAVVPDYPPGCKRILISNDWYPTLQRPDVDVVTDGIVEVEADAIRTADGRRHEVDTIIFGTGFETTKFLAPVEVSGRAGRSLAEVWKEGATAYLGMAVPEFPNLFLLYGPNTNLGHNSIIYMLEAQVRFLLGLLAETVERGADAVEVSRPAMDRWEAEIEAALDRTVWAGECRSWYKTATGRITNNWPLPALAYRLRVGRPDPADFDFGHGPAVDTAGSAVLEDHDRA